MRIINFTKQEKEKIANGSLLLLRDKLIESEKIWFDKLKSGTSDHRHTQGAYGVISDILEVLS